jgi:hypothetical protein
VTAKTVTALRNGIEWKGTTELNFDEATDTLTILCIGYRPNDQVITMRIRLAESGTYTLSKKQGSFYTTVGGDAITSVYSIGQWSRGTYHPVQTLYRQQDV